MSRFAKFSVPIVFVVVLLGSVQTVSAIDFANSNNITVYFEPGLERSVTFTIINNERKDFTAFVYAEGDLKDYVTSDVNIVEFRETDESKPFTYRFRLPEKIEKPGDHWAKIVVMEMPAGMKEGEQIVMATTAVIHQLKVRVPYPGKYADLGLEIHEAEPNETVKFFIKIYNLGEEDIYKAFATIDILGPTNEKIATLESEEISIESRRAGEVIVPWEANVNPGVYHAVVTVNYDGKIARTGEDFGVGRLRIDVLDVRVRSFILGGVAKFEIGVENKWNQRVSDVYAEMVMNDQEGDRIASFKSASVDIGALQRSTLYAYWDTEGVEKGTYDAKLIFHHADKTLEKLLKTYVESEGIRNEIIGVTAKAITRKGEMGPGVDVLVPLVLILIMINIGWFFYSRRRKEKKLTSY
jgi:hypothetical protein